MIVLINTLFISVLYIALIIYYRVCWVQIPEFNTQGVKDKKPSTIISVIIPARNEENNISNCLTSVTSQSYPKNLFEVIVVDDYSTDRTPDIVASFAHQHVSLLTLKDILGGERINSYKKKAIEMAVSQARGELIVTTDADCVVKKEWLETIAFFYESYHPAFIAAPVCYFDTVTDEGSGFLHKFQSIDFMTLQGITGASVYKRFHSMCNGANLAYEKKVFYEVGGFSGIDNIASGDDMLLMHKIFKHYPERILFLKSRDAMVRTKPAETLKEFLNQRIRWASKADKYTDIKITVVLLLVYCYNVWILILGILSLFYPYLFYWFIAILVTKTIVELFFLYPVATFFRREKLLWWFPVAQPFHILYTIVAGWLGKFGTYEWKERKVE